jgi:meckelin
MAADGTCVPTSLTIPSSAYFVYFEDIGLNIRSMLVERILPAAVALCTSGNNRTACQALANICVLQHYRQSSFACTMYRQIAALRPGNVNGWYDWPQGMPWLYAASPPSAPLSLTASLRSGSDLVTNLQLRLASFDVEGHFQGWLDFHSFALLCPNTQASLSAYATVGLAYSNACTLSLTARDVIAKYNPLVLVDAYIVDGDAVVPVPVRLHDGQLVRRFFLFDNSTGRSAASGAQAARIAADVTLRVTFVGPDRPGKMYAPILEVVYRDFAASAASTPVSMQATYTISNDRYPAGVRAASGVCAGLAVLYLVVRMSSWWRRSGSVQVHLRVLLEALAMLATAFGSLALVVLCACSLYWLLFYRREGAVEALLPDRAADPFVPLLAAAFFCKLLECAHLVFTLVSVDIFFIDWEQPSAAGSAATPLWRSVLVANEWHELVPVRKTSVSLQLLVVLFFLEVAGARSLGASAPASTSQLAPDHYLLRFAALSILYFTVGLGQWILHALRSRFVEDKLGQFADMCSVCNVSVFLLRDALFGYYIHGRSVHGTAEVDMWGMRENLRKEEAAMMARRGLISNSDLQTFEMHVPRLMREQLDAVLRGAASHDASGGPGVPSDSALRGYITITRFLSAFLDHSFRDLDYVVQDKLALAATCDLTPDVLDRGIFYPDPAANFATATFFGNELSLFCFDFLVFACVDFLAGNYVAGAFVTFVCYTLVREITSTLAKRNLARKTMIDERFLI